MFKNLYISDMKFPSVEPKSRMEVVISTPFYEIWNRLDLNSSDNVLDNVVRSTQEVVQTLLDDLDSMVVIPERSSITSSFAEGDLVEIAELCANLEMAWRGAKIFFRPYQDVFFTSR